LHLRLDGIGGNNHLEALLRHEFGSRRILIVKIKNLKMKLPPLIPTPDNKVKTAGIILPKSNLAHSIIILGTVWGVLMCFLGQLISGIALIGSCIFIGSIIQLLTDCRNFLKHIADKSCFL